MYLSCAFDFCIVLSTYLKQLLIIYIETNETECITKTTI